MKNCEGLKKLDFYGKTVGFHYEGQDKLRSCSGATVSICVFILIMAVAAFRFLQLATSERFVSFTRHEYNGHFEGMSAPTEDTLYAPKGYFSDEQ